jgi:hypothetical protein
MLHQIPEECRSQQFHEFTGIKCLRNAGRHSNVIINTKTWQAFRIQGGPVKETNHMIIKHAQIKHQERT